MQFSTKQQLIGGGVILVIIGFVAWSTWSHALGSSSSATTTPSTLASSTDSGVTSAPVATSTSTGPFPINVSDSLASWSFKGIYTGNDALVQKANADITLLTSLLGKGKYDDYDLYNGIANDYGMLGEGSLAYQNFNRAIAIHPTKGLAYVNLGHLMAELGAYATAADAYGKAVAVEPGMLEYHLERLTYLTQQFPKDTPRIVAALADASKQFGDNASILAIEARWLSAVGRYADAIKAWQTAKMLLPGKDTSAIDAEIARLQAKQ